MTVPITIDATRHLLYDNQSKTFLGVGANYDRDFRNPTLDKLRVIGRYMIHNFVLDEATIDCDVYTHSGYKLELYWNKEAMDKRWKELRGN